MTINTLSITNINQARSITQLQEQIAFVYDTLMIALKSYDDDFSDLCSKLVNVHFTSDDMHLTQNITAISVMYTDMIRFVLYRFADEDQTLDISAARDQLSASIAQLLNFCDAHCVDDDHDELVVVNMCKRLFSSYIYNRSISLSENIARARQYNYI